MKMKVGEVMTRDVTKLPASATVRQAAARMKEEQIGCVMIENDQRLCGIVTDRDIVVRCIADGGDPDEVTLEQVCSHQLLTLSSSDEISNAVTLMRKKAIRRIPVVEDGRVVGVVSLGDLALERDPTSALGGISAAPANP
jgi:signal-transduction protein with cAMP-binding, CBS, and nucleotidyltransferase domain